MRASRETGRSAVGGSVVITGATSGIGEATAVRLAATAAHLVLVGPEPPSAVDGVIASVRAAGTARVEYRQADFTSLDEVVGLAARLRADLDRVDLLINDAGVPGAASRTLTRDGFERTLQVNALAPALLTRLLVPSMHRESHIVNVASSAHRVADFALDDPDLDDAYAPVTAYARAKLAMVTWSALLAEEERSSGIRVVALCPGLNDTALSATMMGHRVGSPASQGADRVLFAATAEVPSGSYLEQDRVVAPSAESTDPANRERLAALYLQRLLPFALTAGAR